MPAALVRANFNTALIPNLVQSQFGSESIWFSLEFSLQSQYEKTTARFQAAVLHF